MKSVHKINHVNITFWIKSLGMTWKKNTFHFQKPPQAKPQSQNTAASPNSSKTWNHIKSVFPCSKTIPTILHQPAKFPNSPRINSNFVRPTPLERRINILWGTLCVGSPEFLECETFPIFPPSPPRSLSGERSHNRENKSGPRSSTIWFGQHRRDPHQHQHHRWYLYRLVGKMGRWKINCWFKSTGGENKF